MNSCAHLKLPRLGLILTSIPKKLGAKITDRPLSRSQAEPLSDTHGRDPNISPKALEGLKSKLILEPELIEGGSEFAI